MASNNPELHDAIEKLLSANDELLHASSAAGSARAYETKCINAVNDAQKQIDALLDAMKKQAPRQSDWRNQNEMMKPAREAYARAG